MMPVLKLTKMSTMKKQSTATSKNKVGIMVHSSSVIWVRAGRAGETMRSLGCAFWAEFVRAGLV
jgi:Ethanolamine utilization protein EutJ (predicted chaperonin)